MADMIEEAYLIELKRRHPDHCVVCYVNSTAGIKALSDICCTSSNAVKIVRKIAPGQGIIFVPDRHLGDYVAEQTGRSMVLWKGFCPTHVRIEPSMIVRMRKKHPDAVVMIHPEAPAEARRLADRIFSTGQMCEFVHTDRAAQYIVATESGILHTLRKQNPEKEFYPAGNDITCPNMRKGSLASLKAAMEGTGGEIIEVPSEIAALARGALQKMLELGA
jgi:quinolinate synthase